MRLLIVEDDRDIVKALTALFEHNNYSVDAVYNGNDGYDYAVGGSYDGIVMDIMMPGMDGLQVLHALRSAGIKTPVLLLTAKGDIEDKVNGLDAGADDYLPKPFAAAELLARVRATHWNLRDCPSISQPSSCISAQRACALSAANFRCCSS